MKTVKNSISYEDFYKRFVEQKEEFVFDYFSVQLSFTRTASGMCLIYSDAFQTKTMLLPDAESVKQISINNKPIKELWENFNLIKK